MSWTTTNVRVSPPSLNENLSRNQLTSSRNRPRKSPIRNRQHHLLLRRRRPSRLKPHARAPGRRGPRLPTTLRLSTPTIRYARHPTWRPWIHSSYGPSPLPLLSLNLTNTHSTRWPRSTLSSLPTERQRTTYARTTGRNAIPTTRGASVSTAGLSAARRYGYESWRAESICTTAGEPGTKWVSTTADGFRGTDGRIWGKAGLVEVEE